MLAPFCRSRIQADKSHSALCAIVCDCSSWTSLRCNYGGDAHICVVKAWLGEKAFHASYLPLTTKQSADIFFFFFVCLWCSCSRMLECQACQSYSIWQKCLVVPGKLHWLSLVPYHCECSWGCSQNLVLFRGCSINARGQGILLERSLCGVCSFTWISNLEKEWACNGAIMLLRLS